MKMAYSSLWMRYKLFVQQPSSIGNAKVADPAEHIRSVQEDCIPFTRNSLYLVHLFKPSHWPGAFHSCAHLRLLLQESRPKRNLSRTADS